VLPAGAEAEGAAAAAAAVEREAGGAVEREAGGALVEGDGERAALPGCLLSGRPRLWGRERS